MESMSVDSGGNLLPLNNILTEEEQLTLSENISSKLNQALLELNKNLHQVKTQRQQDRVAYGQHTFDLDSQLRDKTGKIESLRSELENERRSCEEYLNKYKTTLAANSNLETDLAKYKKELSILELRLRESSSNGSELSLLAEKRNAEIGKLSEDVARLTEQLQTCSVAKIEAMAKCDQLVSREIEISYKEKQLEKQSEWMGEQIRLLNEELERKQSEIMSLQRESSVKYLHLQTDLSEKIEQAKIAEINLANYKKINEDQEKHIESLVAKLKEAQEVEARIEENYRVELRSQKRVADLYKESSEESVKKLEEMEDGVSNLQELLKQATEKYGELESRFECASKNFQDEISKRDESIKKLESELKSANEVMESIQKHGMTDEMIHSLSPAAAAASTLLKESKSITEIFSKYQEVFLQLSNAKCENMKLHGYIKEILEDIESRAPTLQKQKEEYERAIQTVEILSSQMDVTMAENSKCQTEIVQLKKNCGVFERENERLKLQIQDLARQVKCLLNEQNNDENQSEDNQTDQSPAQRVITNSLVRFRNVDELQKQNLKLLAVVRELSDEREKTEKECQENSLRQIKESFESAKEELRELKELRKRQELQIKTVQQQRDTLNDLLKQNRDSSSKDLSSDISERKIGQLTRELVQVQEEYENYRKEKRENDRLTNSTVEKLRDEISEMRSEKARLVSQVEYHNERVKIYNSNLEGFKKSNALLEERNKQYVVTVLKHEQSIHALKSQLDDSNAKLSRLEVQNQTLTQERNMLRDLKTRLQLEKELLQKETRTSALLQSGLEELKNSVELNNSASRINLENQLDEMKQENGILRRKIETENERYKSAVDSFDNSGKELREKISKLENEILQKSNEFQEKNMQVDKLTAEVESLKNELRLVNNQSTDVIEKIVVSESSLELISVKSEMESLKQQLSLIKENADEYRTLSSALEEQLNIANETGRMVNEEFSRKINEKEEIILQLNVKIDYTENEFRDFKLSKDKILSEYESKIENMNVELSQLRRELSSSKLSCGFIESELKVVKSDFNNQQEIIKELEDKYQRELQLHAGDSKGLRELNVEIQRVKTQLESVVKEKEKIEAVLSLVKSEFESRENCLKSEIEGLKIEVEELRGVNNSLQDRIIQVVKSTSCQNTNNDSFSEGGTGGGDKSSEQWLQLIRYLRREKEISVGKMEIAQAGCQRMESQLKQLQVQYEEVKKQLSQVNDKSHVSVITSGKQAELLRKVETLSALTDSNRTLRDEKESALKELQSLKERLNSIESNELSPLRSKLSTLESENESFSSENETLKQDIERWKTRATNLIEKTNKVNPEEMKKLQNENENLIKNNQSILEQNKKLQIEVNRLQNGVKLLNSQLANVQATNQTVALEKGKVVEEVQRLQEEIGKCKGELTGLKGELLGVKRDLVAKEEEVARGKTELAKLENSLEEHRSTVKQVKTIARKYKKQWEDLLKENEEKIKVESESNNEKEMDQLKTELETLTNENRELLAEKDETIENLQKTLTENEGLRLELEMLKQRLSLIEKQFKVNKKVNSELGTTEGEKPASSSGVVVGDQRVNQPSGSNTLLQQQNKVLTASIRPMSQEKHVTPQNVVQPMLQSQFSGTENLSLVSTSTPEWNQTGRQLVSVSPIVDLGQGSSGGSILGQVGQALPVQQVVAGSSGISMEIRGELNESEVEEEEEEEDEDQEDQQQHNITQESPEMLSESNVSSSEHQAPALLPPQIADPIFIAPQRASTSPSALGTSQLSKKRSRECSSSGGGGETSSSGEIFKKVRRGEESTSSTANQNEAEALPAANQQQEDDDVIFIQEEERDEEEEEEEEEDEEEEEEHDQDQGGHEDQDDDQVGGSGPEPGNSEAIASSGEAETQGQSEEDHDDESVAIGISSSTNNNSANPLPVVLVNFPEQQQQQQQELEDFGDEEVGIVPSTPTLIIHRRGNVDGFAEMASSNRFNFNNREELDIENTGRSVPSTPNIINVSHTLSNDESAQLQQMISEPSSSNNQDEQDDTLPRGSVNLEVPSSSSSTSSNQISERVRPTPIVWDQPSSSSQTPQAPPTSNTPLVTSPPLHPLSQAPPSATTTSRYFRGTAPRGRGQRGHVSTTYNRQLINRMPNAAITTSTPTSQQVMIMRGMQSARRSRSYFPNINPRGQ